MGVRDHPVDIDRIWVEEHGQTQMGDLARSELVIPAAHERIQKCIENKDVFGGEFRGSDVFGRFGHPFMDCTHFGPPVLQPVEPLVLFFSVNQPWSVFTESQRHGKPTGAAADYEHLEEQVQVDIRTGIEFGHGGGRKVRIWGRLYFATTGV